MKEKRVFLVHPPSHFSVLRSSSPQGNNQTDLNPMKKGLHPQLQWISYVTQSGRLIPVMMTKIHSVGKVYHFRAKRQMAEKLGQVAKFKRRYGQDDPDANDK